jgi:uroporphyrinogen-III decarboxylase
MTFWGGMDAQAVLTRCTPDQIRDWVRRVIYALAPGHIVASNHAIQGNVPPQNIWAANEAVEEFSKTVYGNDWSALRNLNITYQNGSSNQ